MFYFIIRVYLILDSYCLFSSWIRIFICLSGLFALIVIQLYFIKIQIIQIIPFLKFFHLLFFNPYSLSFLASTSLILYIRTHML